uniref:DNA replication licensing factor MCM2 n=1 Tax=Chromera velia CCMP2878 TaxID=1169474 RepID=A0A0G4HXT7_9ALVE|mmetsp:Transcript_42548/g.83885  ORF Transcript_42548/g.83885 Transcript_42548/m.83885 type:complete len:970 (-) Transcript_42548:906-3815(-)|eukprot:Cvel_9337.t1-p1 / transcript=Cvel_9337.t1 / gene=Cvel_9337 / organism=Chromera_velia_CCMP2878 / gene_product=DNA replication licensing factor mcm2, putative / transcript_product=DNA replication licensing factor mcm2, putative / location=Cvel_scaffold536:2755-10719(-) / protein_length=969 / sequence_SO=supercontig / SO=protein_coding / is_pseudo=false
MSGRNPRDDRRRRDEEEERLSDDAGADSDEFDEDDEEELVEDEEEEEARVRGQDEAEEDLEAERREMMGEEQAREEEPDDGEDLDANADADYVAIPHLDNYDPALMDDSGDQEELDYQGRREVEAELDRRDRRRRGDAMEDEDEDSEEEYAFRRDRRGRQWERMHQADEEDEDEMEDDDPSDMPTSGRKLDDVTAQKLKRAFRKLIRTCPGKRDDRPLFHDLVQGMTRVQGYSIVVDYARCIRLNTPGLATWISERPLDVLPLLDEVLTAFVRKTAPNAYPEDSPPVALKLRNMGTDDPIRDLRVALLGYLVQVDGVVTKRSAVNPRLQRIYKDCMSCGTTMDPIEASISDPLPDMGTCPACHKRGPFVLNREETVYENFQRLTIQEPPQTVEAGRVPRSKEVILLGDEVDKVRPGDLVRVVGVYKSKREVTSMAKHGFPVFSCILLCNHIERLNDLKVNDLSTEDTENIQELGRMPGIRDIICRSIAPSIFGHRHIKSAIACSMFGGRRKVVQGKHKIRGDVNVLVLGDPGMAKSQFLKFVEKAFYKTVYSTGKGASAVGLTAAVRKDPVTGEWTLEGGALVLADEGICLIDEFDKMSDTDRTSIHEAMEQQSISVSRVGIVTTLQARCAVIAAANPAGGRYDSQLSFNENVELADPILSRFDVLAVVKDEVDTVNDERLADFVVCSHRRSHARNPDTKCVPLGQKRLQNAQKARQQLGEETERTRELGLQLTADGWVLDQDALRKYCLYARSRIFPRLRSVDLQQLEKLYVELRQDAKRFGGLRMTVRHIESIIRMAEANARMRLSQSVEQQDLDEAIALMLNSFCQTQKHAVAQQLEKKYARYTARESDHVGLMEFLLEKTYRAQERNELLRRLDENAEVHVKVPLERFTREIQAAGLSTRQMETFLASPLFESIWEFNRAEGVIMKRGFHQSGDGEEEEEEEYREEEGEERGPEEGDGDGDEVMQ